jgi:hypothetical protein
MVAALGLATGCGDLDSAPDSPPAAVQASDPPPTVAPPPKPRAPLTDGWVWIARDTKLYTEASRSSTSLAASLAPSEDEDRDEAMRAALQQRLERLEAGGPSSDEAHSLEETREELAALPEPAPRRLALRVLGERDGWVEVETMGSGSAGPACWADLDGADLFRLRLYVPRESIAQIIPSEEESPDCASEGTPDTKPDGGGNRYAIAGPPKTPLQFGARTPTIEPATEHEVQAKTRVYWPTGESAGTVTTTHRYASAPETVGERRCFPMRVELQPEPALRLCYDAEQIVVVEPPIDARALAMDAGILGVLGQQQGGFLASPYGGAFAVADDDFEALLGDSLGDSIGAAYGVGGLGMVGTGRGGGGTAEGIGLGSGGGTARIGTAGGTGGVRGHAKVGGTVATGIDPGRAKQTMRRMRSSFRYCYEKHLRDDPAAAGTVTVTVTVGDDGRVSNVKAVGGLDQSARDCVARSARRIRFERSGTVTTTLEFSTR